MKACVISILFCQEEILGLSAVAASSKSPGMLRLPQRLFVDFRPNGALCHLFSAALRFKAEQGWRRFDFQSPSRLEKNLEMLSTMRSELVTQGCWRPPVVLLRPELDQATRDRLREVLQGAASEGVAEVVEEAQATHIVYPAPAGVALTAAGNAQESNEVRLVFREGRFCLYHWRGLPDSYDSYAVLGSDCKGADYKVAPAPHLEDGGAWEVDARWLLFSAEYNEWLVEEDFLVEYQEAARRAGRQPVFPRPCVPPEEALHPRQAAPPPPSAAVAIETKSDGVGATTAGSSASNSAAASGKKKRKRSPSPKEDKGKRKSMRSPGIKRSRGGGGGANGRGRGGGASSAANSEVTTTADNSGLDTEEDLTRDMDDPEPPNRLTEVIFEVTIFVTYTAE